MISEPGVVGFLKCEDCGFNITVAFFEGEWQLVCDCTHVDGDKDAVVVMPPSDHLVEGENEFPEEWELEHDGKVDDGE